MDYRKAVKKTAMAWHIKQAEKEGWIPYDIEITKSGIIKFAKFSRENGDRLFIQPKPPEKFRKYQGYEPKYEALVMRRRAERDRKRAEKKAKENGGETT